MAAYHRVGFMTHITCRLTAKNWDQLQNPTLDIKYGLPLPVITEQNCTVELSLYLHQLNQILRHHLPKIIKCVM